MKMPSASAKTAAASKDGSVQVDATDPVKYIMSIVEKKVRNLEKRKVKLDAYREMAAQQKELQKDQMEAMNKFGDVVANLAFAKELQKQFQGVQGEILKAQKKQHKRDQMKRHEEDLQKFRSLLNVQNVIDSLGEDEIRDDFRTGSNGAVLITSEEFERIDQLYKLITPSREEDENNSSSGTVPFADKLSVASDHISKLLDGKDKEFVGSTYCEMKKLLDKVQECGYLDNPPKPAPAAKEEPADEQEAEEEAAAVETPEDPRGEPANGETEVSEGEEDEGTYTEQQVELQQQPESESDEESTTVVPPSGIVVVSSKSQGREAALEHPRKRTVSEVFKEIQGPFKFMQDSMVDVSDVDPAIVHMKPMAPVAQKQPTQFVSQDDFNQTQSLSNTATSAAYQQQQQQHQQQPLGQQYVSLGQGQPGLGPFLSQDMSLGMASTTNTHQSLMGQQLVNISAAQDQYPPTGGTPTTGPDQYPKSEHYVAMSQYQQQQQQQQVSGSQNQFVQEKLYPLPSEQQQYTTDISTQSQLLTGTTEQTSGQPSTTQDPSKSQINVNAAPFVTSFSGMLLGGDGQPGEHHLLPEQSPAGAGAAVDQTCTKPFTWAAQVQQTPVATVTSDLSTSDKTGDWSSQTWSGRGANMRGRGAGYNNSNQLPRGGYRGGQRGGNQFPNNRGGRGGGFSTGGGGGGFNQPGGGYQQDRRGYSDRGRSGNGGQFQRGPRGGSGVPYRGGNTRGVGTRVAGGGGTSAGAASAGAARP